MARKGKGKRLVLAACVLIVAAGIGGLGWYWTRHLTCKQIDLAGHRFAERGALLKLARVDTGMVLFDLEPRLLEDRLRRHPWVHTADVTRLPTGTLTIRIEERVPVALLLDGAGTPWRYLDRAGHAMPLVAGAVFDVPLLRGVTERLNALRPLQNQTMLALLDALATTDADTDALISEVELKPSGEAWLYTTAPGDHPAIPVRLGRAPYAEKLDRLVAFWQQALLTRPDRRFELIDLRFDSQVVTRENSTGP